MICIIALVVFGILGIFSAYYRRIALEAWDCVFRRITLRKCESNLDQRLKAGITGRLMKRTPRLAGKVFKHFEMISWAFTILMILSIVYSGIGIYNYAKYGNCNGKDETGFCIFDPLNTGSNGASVLEGADKNKLKTPSVGDDPFIGPENAKLTIIEYGCYSCPYTKAAEPVRKEIIEKYPQVKLVFRSFPLPNHIMSREAAEAAQCADMLGKYWEYHNILFDNQEKFKINKNNETFIELAGQAGIDKNKFKDCLLNRKSKEEVDKDYDDGLKAGIYGTPTFFINNETLVGPQKFSKFKKIIEKELEKDIS